MKWGISVHGYEMAPSIETCCNIGGRTCGSISVPKGYWLLPARLQPERNNSGRGPLLWRRGSFDKRTHHSPPLGGKKQVGLPPTANSTASPVGECSSHQITSGGTSTHWPPF
jgi:hypothetical protein